MEKLPTKALYESLTNPRKIVDQARDGELQHSMMKHGVLQALLVRLRPLESDSSKQYEVVLGSRRLRAATAIGLDEVPVTIAEMTDEEVEEAQLVENLQREDVHPLDEADGYRRLRERGVNVADMAAKVGRPAGYIYQRLQLCALSKAGREAFLGGKLSAASALVVARIPDEALQNKAVQQLVEPDFRGDLPTAREASRLVRERYMLRLADAPFKTDDPDLVDKAGACSVCPQRTGNQPELFDDVDSDDLCTAPNCYESKLDAHWKVVQADAREKGWEVITAAKALKEIFPYGSDQVAVGCGYVDMASHCIEDPKHRTYARLLGKKHPRTLARAPSGKIVELVTAKGLARALRDAGHDFRKQNAGAGGSGGKTADGQAANDNGGASDGKAAAPAAITARDLARKAHDLAIGEVVKRIEKRAATTKLWRTLALHAARMDVDYGGDMSDRRGWSGDVSPNDAFGHAEKDIAKMTEGELRGLVFEALLPTQVHWGGSEGKPSDELKALCKEYGVDLKKTEAAAKKALEAERKAAKAKKNGKASSKAEAKKGEMAAAKKVATKKKAAAGKTTSKKSQATASQATA